jgi:hypothetical protein
MIYSRDSVRWAITLALVVIGLFHTPSGPAHARRRPGSPPQARLDYLTKSVASDALTPLMAADRQTRARVSDQYIKLPLRFEANSGQTDAQVRFISRSSGYNLFLTPTEAVLASRNGNETDNAQSIVRMKLAGASSAPQMEGLEALPGKSHYFIGNDPGKWRRDVKSYARVRYRSVYPGIDLVYYGNQQELEYDFVIAPGADPKAIKLTFDGVRQIRVDAQGDLVLDAEGGEVRQRKPVAYQEAGGHRQQVASRYRLTEDSQVCFELGDYDRAWPLVIDPVIAYSALLGGNSSDLTAGIAVDAEGNAYVVGYTLSTDFPTVDPLETATGNGQPPPGINAFVAKLNPSGSALLYSSYLGGGGNDIGRNIALDHDGDIYVVGTTDSTDFPTMNPLQPSPGGGFDVFAARLSADGSKLIYSTYLGGSGDDAVAGMAIDAKGSVYLTGFTASSDFPTQNPLQPAFGGGERDAFVARLNAAGSALVYSTYLGGSGDEGIALQDIALDRDGNAYITGATTSPDFPTVNPFQPALAGDANNYDGFLTKMDGSGRRLIYSTYLGGSGGEEIYAVAVDSTGHAYVTGITDSADLPTVNPYQSALSGADDIFVAKFNRSGSALVYSTYLGGTKVERVPVLAVDSQGRAVIAGITESIDFPTVDAVQPTPEHPIPDRDGFVARLSASGSALDFATYLGGSGADQAAGIALDTWGDVYVVGLTASEDFPTTPGAFQPGVRSSEEAFVTKISHRRHGNGDKGGEK